MVKYIKASVEEDEDMDLLECYDDFFPNKYMVKVIDHSDLLRTDDPRKAVECWCRNARKFSMDIYITANNKNSAIELIKWCYENDSYLENLCNKYRVPYKVSYILDSVQDKWVDKCSGFQFAGDQVFPFAFG